MKLALPILFLVACAAGTRQTAIKTTLATTIALRDTWHTYDDNHQHVLNTMAKDEESGKVALAQWRVERDKVEKLTIAVLTAVGEAATLNTDTSFNGLTQAALLLANELQTIGVIPK